MATCPRLFNPKVRGDGGHWPKSRSPRTLLTINWGFLVCQRQLHLVSKPDGHNHSHTKQLWSSIPVVSVQWFSCTSPICFLLNTLPVLMVTDTHHIVALLISPVLRSFTSKYSTVAIPVMMAIFANYYLTILLSCWQLSPNFANIPSYSYLLWHPEFDQLLANRFIAA